jgi:hypothetical protein
MNFVALQMASSLFGSATKNVPLGRDSLLRAFARF